MRETPLFIVAPALSALALAALVHSSAPRASAAAAATPDTKVALATVRPQ